MHLKSMHRFVLLALHLGLCVAFSAASNEDVNYKLTNPFISRFEINEKCQEKTVILRAERKQDVSVCWPAEDGSWFTYPSCRDRCSFNEDSQHPGLNCPIDPGLEAFCWREGKTEDKEKHGARGCAEIYNGVKITEKELLMCGNGNPETYQRFCSRRPACTISADKTVLRCPSDQNPLIAIFCTDPDILLEPNSMLGAMGFSISVFHHFVTPSKADTREEIKLDKAPKSDADVEIKLEGKPKSDTEVKLELLDSHLSDVHDKSQLNVNLKPDVDNSMTKLDGSSESNAKDKVKLDISSKFNDKVKLDKSSKSNDKVKLDKSSNPNAYDQVKLVDKTLLHGLEKSDAKKTVKLEGVLKSDGNYKIQSDDTQTPNANEKVESIEKEKPNNQENIRINENPKSNPHGIIKSEENILPLVNTDIRLDWILKPDANEQIKLKSNKESGANDIATLYGDPKFSAIDREQSNIFQMMTSLIKDNYQNRVAHAHNLLQDLVRDNKIPGDPKDGKDSSIILDMGMKLLRLPYFFGIQFPQIVKELQQNDLNTKATLKSFGFNNFFLDHYNALKQNVPILDGFKEKDDQIKEENKRMFNGPFGYTNNFDIRWIQKKPPSNFSSEFMKSLPSLLTLMKERNHNDLKFGNTKLQAPTHKNKIIDIFAPRGFVPKEVTANDQPRLINLIPARVKRSRRSASAKKNLKKRGVNSVVLTRELHKADTINKNPDNLPDESLMLSDVLKPALSFFDEKLPLKSEMLQKTQTFHTESTNEQDLFSKTKTEKDSEKKQNPKKGIFKNIVKTFEPIRNLFEFLFKDVKLNGSDIVNITSKIDSDDSGFRKVEMLSAKAPDNDNLRLDVNAKFQQEMKSKSNVPKIDFFKLNPFQNPLNNGIQFGYDKNLMYPYQPKALQNSKASFPQMNSFGFPFFPGMMFGNDKSDVFNGNKGDQNNGNIEVQVELSFEDSPGKFSQFKSNNALEDETKKFINDAFMGPEISMLKHFMGPKPELLLEGEMDARANLKTALSHKDNKKGRGESTVVSDTGREESTVGSVTGRKDVQPLAIISYTEPQPGRSGDPEKKSNSEQVVINAKGEDDFTKFLKLVPKN